MDQSNYHSVVQLRYQSMFRWTLQTLLMPLSLRLRHWIQFSKMVLSLWHFTLPRVVTRRYLALSFKEVVWAVMSKHLRLFLNTCKSLDRQLMRLCCPMESLTQLEMELNQSPRLLVMNCLVTFVFVYAAIPQRASHSTLPLMR